MNLQEKNLFHSYPQNNQNLSTKVEKFFSISPIKIITFSTTSYVAQIH